MFAITALLGAAAVALFVFQVMLVVSDREGGGGSAWDEARDGAIETAGGAGDVGASGVQLIGAALGILSLPMLALLGALLVATAVGIGLANFGDELSGAFDESFTELWPPFYRTLVLGVADPVLSLWNVVVPIANSLNGSWRIFRSNAFGQAVDCDGVDWADFALKLRDAVLFSMNSIVSWSLGLAADDFDFYTPMVALQIALTDVAPVVGCWCEVVEPLSDVIVESIASHELAAVVDRSLNLPINAIKDVAGSIVTYFKAFGRAAASGKTFFEALGDYYWEPDRMPSVERTIRTLGQLIARLMDWLDDVVVAISGVFFGVPDDHVPRIFGILGNYAESVVLDANVVADSWGFSFVSPFGGEKAIRRLALLGTRYDDALWNKSRGVALRTEDLLTDAFDKAYNASALAEVAFQTIGFPLATLNDSNAAAVTMVLLNYTGCMTREVLDVATGLLEIVARLWVASFHERIVGGDYGQYLRDPPFNDALHESIDSAERFGVCAAGFAAELDDELGTLVNETGHVIKAVIAPFIELQVNWGNRTGYFKSPLYSGLVDQVFVEMDAWAIAVANFVRQFAFAGEIGTAPIDPDVECRVRDVHAEQSPTGTNPAWESFYPWYVDPFCCLGGALEEFLRLYIGIFEGLTRAIVAFAQETTFKAGFVRTFEPGGPLDMRMEFLPMVDFLLRDLFRFSCVKFGVGRIIGESIFNATGFATACNSGTDTIWEYTVEVITGVVRVPIKFVIGGAAEIWAWIVAAIDGAPCAATCWCGRLQGLYSITLGETFDWVADLMHLVACLFAQVTDALSNLTNWADSLKNIMGSAASGGAIATGDLLCNIVSFFVTIWDLFQCWADGGGFVACIFDTILAAFEDLLNAVIDCLKSAWSELKEVILCIPAGIWDWIQAFIGDFGCVFDGDNPCPKLSIYLTNCKFVIPAECGAGSLGLTTGEVGITFEDLKTETYTRIIGNCEQYTYLSEAWFACIALATSTQTATMTRYVEFAHIVKRAQKISNTQGNFIGSLSSYDWFGRGAACIGDLDGDGVPDLAVGAELDDDGPGTDRGAVWILFMNRDGTVKSEQKISDTLGSFGGGLADGDNFGHSIASLGDLDGDGITDIVVGAPGYGVAGAVWILFLTTSGTVASEWRIDNSSLGGGLSAADVFGQGVANIGDLDGDGVIDIAVGAPQDGANNVGAVWILFLNSTGVVDGYQKINNVAGSMPATIPDFELFGYSIATVGDLDSDGYNEIFVGARGDDDGDGIDSGAGWILSLSVDGTVSWARKISDTSPGGMDGALRPAGRFGDSAAGLGDMDGDGIPDLVVGASEDDTGVGERGAIYIMFLNADGTVREYTKVSDTQGGMPFALDLGDRFGGGVAAIGDLDGDGIVDIAVGAYRDDDGAANAGAVYVLFLGGESTRFRKPDSIVRDESSISDTTGGFAGVLDNADRFGHSVAWLGDIDGDGGPDVAVGAPGDDNGGLPQFPNDEYGAVWILFLSPDGGTVLRHQKLSNSTGGLVSGPTLGDTFGNSVASVGDLDGDNVTDIIIGAPFDNDGGSARGAVWIVFLNANGTAKGEQKISDTQGNFTGALTNIDNFGWSVASLGDLDGDNVTDVAVGAQLSGGSDYGKVWILFLRANGTVKGHVAIDETTVGISLSIGDQFGSSIAALPDVDGDGVADIAVGAAKDGGVTVRGSVHVIFMTAGGGVKGEQIISDTQGELQGVLRDDAEFGTAVASAGDLDDDGVPDLMVGALGGEEGGIAAGSVWMLFLRENGVVKGYEKINYYEGGFLGSLSPGDEFGRAVEFVGDLDGNGARDLIVGAPKSDDGSVDINADRGAVWVTRLNPIASDIVHRHRKVSNSSGDFDGALLDGDGFGKSIAAIGDLDGDNVTDLAVGAWGDDTNGTDRGAVWILFMNADGTVKSEQKIGDVDGGFAGALSDGDNFGHAVATLGDLDGDGVVDIAVGAPGDDTGGLARGAVWILFLNPNGTVKAHQKISDADGGFPGSLSDGDQFGNSIAALGDFNADNVTDVAVGSFGESAGRGGVWVLIMRPNGTVITAQHIAQGLGGLVGPIVAGDLFGSSLAAIGDLNADGVPDVAVGAVGDSDGGAGGYSYGAVWILFLNAFAGAIGEQKISPAAGDFEGAIVRDGEFGSAVASVGDLDGDGIGDLAVGNARDHDGGTARGAVWLLYMNRDGTVKATATNGAFRHGACDVPSTNKISYTSGGFVGILDDGDLFGTSIAAIGDLDGNGTIDLVVGAPSDDDGGSARGAIWTLFLNDLATPLPAGKAAAAAAVKPNMPSLRGLDSVARKRAVTIATSSAATSTQLVSATWNYSSTGSGPPEVIDFDDIDRWCSEEGTHLSLLQGAVGINENSTQIGDDQREINRRLINASLYQMSMSYQACLASATVARIVDIGIGFVSKNETLVHPKTFYDPFRFMYFSSRVILVAPIAFEYHFERVGRDPRTLTGGEFAAHLEIYHNVTDALTVNLGLYADRMLRAARVLIYDNKANILGHLVNTFGQLFYAPPPPGQLAGASRVVTIYGEAPLHPAGWQSPRWLEFRDRYASGLVQGYAAWHRAAGVQDRSSTFEYVAALPSTIVNRVEWNRAGRDPSTEPYPRGRLAQRARFENLLDRESAPRHAWESNETAQARQLYALAERHTKYPSLSEAGFVGKHQDLISSDFVCPLGVKGRDYNCSDRACWSPAGAVAGACETATDSRGRPRCGCDYASTSGSCCNDTACASVASSTFCGADSIFAPGVACAAGECAAARGACCASDGTCAIRSRPSRCSADNSTFLVGSSCAACADASLIAGACCDAGACSMTVESACAGTWNSRKNCSSQLLDAECQHCGVPPCISCDLLFATVNDVVDLWIMNLELINASGSVGACCYGSDPTNRSCEVLARSTCDDDRADSVWFWGEQCTFCQSQFAYAMPAQGRAVRAMLFESDIDTFALRAFGSIVNFALRQGAKVLPSLEGRVFDEDAFAEDVALFFFSSDREDPRSWTYWLDFLAFCDVFDHLFPDVGPQGIGLVPGIVWGTIAVAILYALLSRCCPFLGGLLAGAILLYIWIMVVLVFAYYYSPGCYGTAFLNLPRYVFRARAGKAQKQASAAPIAGAGAGAPFIGGRIGKLTNKLAAGMTRIRGGAASAIRNAMLFMFSFPMLPVQLGPDVRDDILARFDVDCLPRCDVACPRESGKWPCAWTTDEDRAAGISCLDAPDCCAVAECPPSRVFPACRAAPFEFRGSTREIAYWFRVWAPKANCFLLHSDFFLLSWIRQLPGVEARLDFPGDECSDPEFDADARWRHCAKQNVLLLSPWLIAIVIAYVLVWGVVALLWVALKVALRFARRITSFWTVASANAAVASAPADEPPESTLASGRATRAHFPLGRARDRAATKTE